MATNGYLFIDTGALQRLGKAGMLDLLLPSLNGTGRQLVVTGDVDFEIRQLAGPTAASIKVWLDSHINGYTLTARVARNSKTKNRRAD